MAIGHQHAYQFQENYYYFFFNKYMIRCTQVTSFQKLPIENMVHLIANESGDCRQNIEQDGSHTRKKIQGPPDLTLETKEHTKWRKLVTVIVNYCLMMIMMLQKHQRKKINFLQSIQTMLTYSFSKQGLKLPLFCCHL